MEDNDNSGFIRKRIIELEEQLRVCQEDNKRKDDHITVLSSMDITRVVPPAIIDTESKAELASLQCQFSIIQDKLREKEREIRERDLELSELREINKVMALTVRAAESRRDKCDGCEAASTNLERDLQRASAIIVDLEGQIRHMEASMRIDERSKEGLSEDIDQFYKDLTAHLDLDTDSDPRTVLSKIKHLSAALERTEASNRYLSTNRECDGFKESLSEMLGSSFSHCPLNEEGIKEHLRKLIIETKEKERTISQLQERLKSLAEHFERNFDNSKECEGKARRIEAEHVELKEHIRHLGKELSLRDASLDELRVGKEKFLHFLRRLSAVLRVDSCSKDGDVSVTFDVLLERTSRAIKDENDREVGTSQTIASLQKRVRNLKDQVHSRDLHLELMRKKVANLEDQVRDACGEINQRRDAFEREDTANQKTTKVQQKVAQLRDDNKALRAELFEYSEVNVLLNKRNIEYESLQQKLLKLEKVHQRQGETVADLSKDIEARNAENSETKVASDNAVQSLSSELRNLRSALDRARTSEHELLDFRKVIGRILGLEVDDLSIPNYDIIRHLEKLVSIPLSSVTMALPTNYCPIRPGYEDARRLLGRQKISPYTRLYTESGRPRSVSPIHDVKDKRKY